MEAGDKCPVAMQKHSIEGAFSAGLRQAKKRRSLGPFEEYRRRPTERLRERLVTANWGLVQKEARRWTHQCSESFEDLCQEGSFGLIYAIEQFDPSSGNAFSSFAMPWIRGKIQHYLRDKGWGTLRVPRQAVEAYSKVKGAQRRMLAMGRDLTDEQVAIGLGISCEKWQFIKRVREAPTPVSLDESPIEIEDEATVQEDLTWVYEHLEKLPDVQRQCIVERVFGEVSIEVIAERRQLRPVVVQGLIAAGLAAMRSEIEVKHGSYSNY